MILMMKLSSGGVIKGREFWGLRVSPSWKMEEKQNKTKSLAVWFPIYLNDLPSYLKFQQRPVWYNNTSPLNCYLSKNHWFDLPYHTGGAFKVMCIVLFYNIPNFDCTVTWTYEFKQQKECFCYLRSLITLFATIN